MNITKQISIKLDCIDVREIVERHLELEAKKLNYKIQDIEIDIESDGFYPEVECTCIFIDEGKE